MWTAETRALVDDFGAGQALSDEQYRLRLTRDYEELPEVEEAMVKLAMIRLMLHRLAHPNRKRLLAT